MKMAEPASGAGAGFLAAKLGALLGAGALGAILIAAIDPYEAIQDPKKRRRLIFTQVLVAAVMAGFFTLPAVRMLDHLVSWIDLRAPGTTIEDWLEVVSPVGLLIGALSWGILGAIVKLRQLIRDRGADVLGGRVGLGP